MSSKPPIDQLYNLVANEEDVRACKDIPDSACHEVPGNFFLILASLVLTKLGDLLISPKTVLAWLLGTVGAPAAMVAWLVPIRESGSMIPQLVIGAWVRRHPVRKLFWVAGSLAQGLCVAAMALAVITLEGATAGAAIIGLLVAFSLARGFCSVALKDVQGKTIPKNRRGRLSGLATTLAGGLTVIVALTFFLEDSQPGLLLYVGLLLAAAFAWLAAALLFSRVTEFSGETAGGGHALRDAIQNLSLLREDKPFRNFVMVRALLLSSALAASFFTLLAQQQGETNWLLGGFLLASSVASASSASIWGWMADSSSRQVIIRGGFMASAVCLAFGAATTWADQWITTAWFYPLGFFILSIAHAGVRLGRKTYLVDMAGGSKRTDYVSVSNSVIGILLLLTGAIGALAAMISPGAVLLSLGTMGAIGVLLAARLPEVE